MSSETKVFPAIDPAIFRRQMRTFDRMREIDAEARRVEKQREERRPPRLELVFIDGVAA